MKFPWRSRNELEPVFHQEEAPEPEPEIQCHRSPGLLGALESLRPDRTSSVLDLGPAVSDNVAFLAERTSRLQIVDALRPGESGDPVSATLRALEKLEGDRGRAFDLVLAWDLFDYLPKDRTAALVDLLSRLSRPNARLHLIVSGTDTMPVHPARYRIVDAGNLSYEQTTAEKIGSPKQTPALVEKTLDGFHIEHSFVLRHGVHEFVAARSD